MQKFILFLGATLLLVSCQQNFKKGDKGLEYKIISDGKGQQLKVGNFMQMNIRQSITLGEKDSVLNDSRTTSGPVIETCDSTSMPPEYFKIISQLRKGDSLVIRLLVDSMFAKNPQSMPPFIKKGSYFTTTVKLLNIFNSRAQADSAFQAEQKLAQYRDSVESASMLIKDDKFLQDYLKKNKINAVKGEAGTYVQILQEGIGPKIDTSVIVKTNYTGRTLDGKMFDSNTDSSKGHVEPFDVNMTNDRTLGSGVIKGWTDGLKMLNKGAKAKFYIPSALAYGAKGAGEDIKPNSILIFDIEVLDILTKDQAKKTMDAKVEEYKQKQKIEMQKAAAAKKEQDKIEAAGSKKK
jgi:FKBP-type peptidyl-prolyl cis-trans isomerase FkpA